jgi:hypothetical protein
MKFTFHQSAVFLDSGLAFILAPPDLMEKARIWPQIWLFVRPNIPTLFFRQSAKNLFMA